MTTQLPIRIAVLAVVLTMAFPSVNAGEDSRATPLPKAKLEPFFQKYCIRCHGPE